MYTKVIKIILSILGGLLAILVIVFGAGRKFDNAVTKIDTNAQDIKILTKQDSTNNVLMTKQQTLMELLNQRIDLEVKKIEENAEDIEKQDEKRDEEYKELIKEIRQIKEGGS